jgi:60S ribosome subunit biogenesis protein NIP7
MIDHFSESIMKKSVVCGRKELISLGTQVGKFSKTKKFKIQITFLDYLAQYAVVGFLHHWDTQNFVSIFS